MLAVLADAQFGLLELVDLLVDALEATVVGGAEVLSASDGSDVTERTFVELGIHRHVLHAYRCLHRHAGLTVTTDADGIDTDTEGLGDLGRSAGRYLRGCWIRR